jgi:small subunit ribosomal protein S3
MKGEVYGKRELSPLVGMTKKTGQGGDGGAKANNRQRRRK